MGIFYEKKGQKIGPIEIDKLEIGEILPRTLVWRKGLENWVEARELVELKDYFKALVVKLESTPPPIPSKKELKDKVRYDSSLKEFGGSLIGLGLVIFVATITVTIYVIFEGGNVLSDSEFYSSTYYQRTRISESKFHVILRNYVIFYVLTSLFTATICAFNSKKLNRSQMNWALIGLVFNGLGLIVLGTRKKLKKDF